MSLEPKIIYFDVNLKITWTVERTENFSLKILKYDAKS